MRTAAAATFLVALLVGFAHGGPRDAIEFGIPAVEAESDAGKFNAVIVGQFLRRGLDALDRRADDDVGEILIHGLDSRFGGRMMEADDEEVLDEAARMKIAVKPRDDFYASAHPTPADTLVIIEVADSTVETDRRNKIPTYAFAGVPEVWLIDPKRHTVAIYRLANAKYGPPTIQKMSGRTRLTVVPEVSVDWDRVNARALNED